MGAVTGIYRILNTFNQKCYIGQAVNIKKRFSEHLYHLKKGDHDNSHLQNSWNIHGEAMFVFQVIRESSKEELTNWEQYELDIIPKSQRYNFGDCVSSPNLGRKFTKEHRKKLSESNKGYQNFLGKTHTSETREKMKKSAFKRSVNQICKTTGAILNTFISIKDAASSTAINRGDIGGCCRGKLKSAGGFNWKYKIDD